jgi:hypothetical protein
MAITEASVDSVRVVSRRLLAAMLVIVAILVSMYVFLEPRGQLATLPVIMLLGALGAFISLQRRLKSLSEKDLTLIRTSFAYTWLAPMTGAVLAVVLYLFILSGLLGGEMFPKPATTYPDGRPFGGLFETFSGVRSEYAKLFAWSFIAGYSEKLVTNIIGRFETGEGTG